MLFVYVVPDAPKLPSVSVSPSGQIVEGSSVNLTCSSDANPAANYTWYKTNGNLELQPLSKESLTFSSIKSSDSGDYHCTAENELGNNTSKSISIDVTFFPRAQKSAVIGITAALFLAIILLSVFLLIRKKRTSEQSSEPGERRDDGEQPEEPEEQNLYYASVRFVKNNTDPVYSNITVGGPRRHKEEEEEEDEEEEEGVEYSVVKFNSSPPRGQETGEDPTALYSTVNKP
ncbi:hemicentin-1-like isoform X1 [Lates japonicus]|uniref:Hemicentin-1-like isoform X1 n=1 Tax=Lates japonicus TaxID=270547 RepID=A0AAD3RDD7_LATJO|nr:hemicentin-1-like isoform X1 [Lates japonicus]